MLIAGGAESHARDARLDVVVRFARLDASGLRVLRVGVPEGEGSARLVRWLAGRTAFDRRGTMRWLCLDGGGADGLRGAVADARAAGSDIVVDVGDARDPDGSADPYQVVCGSTLLDPPDARASRTLAAAWSRVAPGGVLICVAALGAGGRTLGEVARLLETAAIAVVDALACVADDGEHAVLEITRL